MAFPRSPASKYHGRDHGDRIEEYNDRMERIIGDIRRFLKGHPPFTALIFGACIVLIGVALWLGGSVFAARMPYWQSNYALSKLTNTQYQQYFEPHIDIFFRQEGIQGMIDRTIRAFASRQIDMVACHSIAHDIGHYAGYQTNFPDIGKYLTKQNLDFCGSGFIHGIEGQLAYETYPQNVDDLYSFCKLIEPFHPYYDGCYHGAGHSFKEENSDPQAALSWCDKLKYDDTIHRDDCYRGVFNQTVDDFTKLGKTDSDLFHFCSSLPEDEQFDCGIELNGFNIRTDADKARINEKLAECLDPQNSPIIQSGCVGGIATAVADYELGERGEVTPPSGLFSLNGDLIKVYIEYTYGAFRKTAALDPQRSLRTFCDAFTEETYKTYCESKAGLVAS